MKHWPTRAALGLLLGIATADLSSAGPVSAEEARRQAQVLEQLRKALGAETADAAAAALRALRVADDGKDNEGLADARVQALYQITRDNALLKPFYERLKSKDARERERGVIAFRFLKLKGAPAELVNALKDSS